MIRHLSNNRFFLVVTLLGFLLTCFGLYEIYNYKRAFDRSLFWREHTHDVLSEIDKVKSALTENGAVYLDATQGHFLESLAQSSKPISTAIEKIGFLTQDNKRQVPRVDSLERLAHNLIDGVRISQAESKAGTSSASTALMLQRKDRFVRMEKLLSVIKSEEENLLTSRIKVNNESINSLNNLFFILLGALVILLVIAFLSVRATLKSRSKNEEQLLLFKSIINSSDDFIVSTDLNNLILNWNPGAQTIFGYDRGEVIGKHISLLFAAARLTGENLVAEGARKGNYISQRETQWKHKNGDIIEISVTVSPISDSTGRLFGSCNIGRDITPFKRSEDALTYKAQQARDMLDLINDGVIILDHNFCLLYLNKKYGEMMHRDQESLIGKCVWEEFPEAVGTPTYLAIQKGMAEQKYLCTVDYFQPLDLWHENHVYPSASGVFVFVRDITQHKRTEEKIRISEKIYKNIASSIPGSIICLFDRDLRYTLVEGDLLVKIGYTKEMLLGFRAEDVLTPERFAAVLPTLKRALSGESFITEDLREGYDTVSRYVPLKDENNEVTAVMVVVIDVSELQIAHRKIVNLNAELEHKVIDRTQQLALINRELESFSYSVAHDLRTPLRAISGYATMLLEDYSDIVDTEGNRLLTLVEINARKMGVLIDELLTFSKLGRKQLFKVHIDMNKLVEQCIAEMGLEEKIVRQITIHSLPPCKVDASLMKYVINNLLSNAIKYSSKNSDAKIEISSLKEGDEVIYSFADNGVGFDMAYSSKLFGVFQRLHSASEFEGTGVGLAIVQRIINRHDGKVWANSEVGKGATFSFSLPSVESFI